MKNPDPKPDSVPPWTCPKCGAIVHVSERLHEYLCEQYRKAKVNK